jgi:hypothetical protein
MRRSKLLFLTKTSDLCLLGILICTSYAARAEAESGRSVRSGSLGQVTHPPGAHPMFTYWT